MVLGTHLGSFRTGHEQHLNSLEKLSTKQSGNDLEMSGDICQSSFSFFDSCRSYPYNFSGKVERVGISFDEKDAKT